MNKKLKGTFVGERPKKKYILRFTDGRVEIREIEVNSVRTFIHSTPKLSSIVPADYKLRMH